MSQLVFTTESVISICKTLKCKKANGHDNLVAEHFKYGGPICMSLLAKVFSGMCIREHIPPQVKEGAIIPISKGVKDSAKQVNYRGITLTSTMRKIFWVKG